MHPVQECSDDLQSQGEPFGGSDCGRYKNMSLCRIDGVADGDWDFGSSSGCLRSCLMSARYYVFPFPRRLHCQRPVFARKRRHDEGILTNYPRTAYDRLARMGMGNNGATGNTACRASPQRLCKAGDPGFPITRLRQSNGARGVGRDNSSKRAALPRY